MKLIIMLFPQSINLPYSWPPFQILVIFQCFSDPTSLNLLQGLSSLFQVFLENSDINYAGIDFHNRIYVCQVKSLINWLMMKRGVGSIADAAAAHLTVPQSFWVGLRLWQFYHAQWEACLHCSSEGPQQEESLLPTTVSNSLIGPLLVLLSYFSYSHLSSWNHFPN